MTWKLWLDDQLHDPELPFRHAPKGFLGEASTFEAIELVQTYGVPSFMDLDHDLGGADTAMVFLKWLSENYPEGPVPDWHIHSKNIVGAENISSFLETWERVLGQDSAH